MANPSPPPLPRTAHFLTLLALVPQILFLWLTLTDGQESWTAPAAAFAYVAFIFSFLGGLWWQCGLNIRPFRPQILILAVAPMLLAFALFLPWIWGWRWPGPQLVILGCAVAPSFLVDRWLARMTVFDPAWIRLRTTASVLLGLLTLAIGLLACAQGMP